jgi:hypothetical protein
VVLFLRRLNSAAKHPLQARASTVPIVGVAKAMSLA